MSMQLGVAEWSATPSKKGSVRLAVADHSATAFMLHKKIRVSWNGP